MSVHKWMWLGSRIEKSKVSYWDVNNTQNDYRTGHIRCLVRFCVWGAL